MPYFVNKTMSIRVNSFLVHLFRHFGSGLGYFVTIFRMLMICVELAPSLRFSGVQVLKLLSYFSTMTLPALNKLKWGPAL